MIRRIVPEWLAPLERTYRKPKDWADNLKPALVAPPSHPDIPNELRHSIRMAQEAVLRSQDKEEGFWCADLKADTTIASDTIMLLNFLGRGNSVKVRKIANHLLNEQLPCGGWPIFRNGPAEISATVKAYWALKFAEHSPNDPRMAAARRRIRNFVLLKIFLRNWTRPANGSSIPKRTRCISIRPPGLI